MIYSIEPDRTVLELKKEFTDLFPGLKIEVFAHDHESGEGSPKKDAYKGVVTVSEINPKQTECSLILDPEMTVAEVEEKFHSEAGLNVQVFRKMGVIWLETVQTDGYTLTHQMELSAESRHL